MVENDKPIMHVVFTRASNYRTIAANGAWGGLSPSGDVVVDFNVDRHATPDEMDVFSGKDDTLREKRVPSDQPVIREAQVGMVLRPATAKAIGEFLIRYANQAMGITQETSEGDEQSG